MGNALFTTGDIFERGADLTVLPCSAKGHISRTAERHVQNYNLPFPKESALGSIQVYPFPGPGKDSKMIAWASSVMHFTSRVEIIEEIGFNLGQFSNKHPEVQFIESPLLGTGAGGLDPFEAGPALQMGFEKNSKTDTTLFIYSQLSTVVAKLRGLSANEKTSTAFHSLEQTMHKNQPIEIFFSYAHEDEDLMNFVRTQLIVEERNGRIIKWHDRKISPGSNWQDEIDERLKQAQIILLFLSPHFIESEYCYEIEGIAALEKHRNKTAIVVPIILRPCMWEKTPFGKLLALPSDGKPLSAWEDLYAVSLDVAKNVINLVDQLIIDSK